MKIKDDHYTRDLLSNKPGRPRNPNALTGAQRVAKFRAKKLKKKASVAGNENCSWCGSFRTSCCGICNIGQLGHKG